MYSRRWQSAWRHSVRSDETRALGGRLALAAPVRVVGQPLHQLRVEELLQPLGVLVDDAVHLHTSTRVSPGSGAGGPYRADRAPAVTHRIVPVGVAEQQAHVGHELRHVRVALRARRLQLQPDHVQAHRPRDLQPTTLTHHHVTLPALSIPQRRPV